MTAASRRASRRATAKRWQDTTNWARYVGYCDPCEKYGYATRADAKKAHRQQFPAATNLSVYPCPETPDGATGLYHFGHMPKAHVAGQEPWWWHRGMGRPTDAEGTP